MKASPSTHARIPFPPPGEIKTMQAALTYNFILKNDDVLLSLLVITIASLWESCP